MKLQQFIILFSVYLFISLGFNLQQTEHDINSISSYIHVEMLKQTADITLNFADEKVEGKTTMFLKAKVDITEILFDIWGIDIKAGQDVLVSVPNPPAGYKALDPIVTTDPEVIEQYDSTWGGTLALKLENLLRKDDDSLSPKFPAGTEFQVEIVSYKTESRLYDRGMTGYTFVKRENTHTKQQPFFYTQNMPIYARTWLPSFDTPLSQQQIELNVQVPNGITVISSGKFVSRTPSGDNTIFKFEHDATKVSTSQIGLVAGALIKQHIDYQDLNIHIYAEDGEVMNQLYDALQDIGLWIQTAASILDLPLNEIGIDKLDIALMPPNYPYEGQQHGQLMQLSPSVTTFKYRRERTIIFHQIAALYFGNRAGCANWQNVWLNTGFQTYIERKMGNQLISEAYEKLDRIDGNFTLENTFEYMKIAEIDTTFTTLHPNTQQRNPYESFSPVSYEKGYQFLVWLGQWLEGEDNILKLLKQWLEFIHAQTPAVADYKEFQEFINQFVQTEFQDGKHLTDEVMKSWVTDKGFPPEDTIKDFSIDHQSVEYDEVALMADKFIQFNGAALPKNYQDIRYWNEDKLVQQLEKAYKFSDVKDLEVKSRWFKLVGCLRFLDPDMISKISDFLSSTGVPNLLIPAYEGLMEGGEEDQAFEFYESNANFYHPIAFKEIERTIFADYSPPDNNLIIKTKI